MKAHDCRRRQKSTNWKWKYHKWMNKRTDGQRRSWARGLWALRVRDPGPRWEHRSREMVDWLQRNSAPPERPQPPSPQSHSSLCLSWPRAWLSIAPWEARSAAGAGHTRPGFQGQVSRLFPREVRRTEPTAADTYSTAELQQICTFRHISLCTRSTRTKSSHLYLIDSKHM